MANVLAQSDDGSWLPVGEAGDVPAQTAQQLLRGDLAIPFGLAAPTLVVCTEPDLPGAPDALGITVEGRVVLVLSVCSDPVLTRSRLAAAADALRNTSFVELICLCRSIGANDTPGSWLAASYDVDALVVDAAIETNLARGDISLLVLAREGYERIAAPFLEVQTRTGLEMDCHDLLLLEAGTVRLIEAYAVSDRELRSSAKLASQRSDAKRLTAAAGHELGSDVEPLYRALCLYSEAFFTEVTFSTVGELISMQAWLEHEEQPLPVLELLSSGAVTIRLDALDEWNSKTFVAELERIVGVDLASGESLPSTLQLSVTEHLNDVSLIEQFAGAVSDAMIHVLERGLLRARAA